jgi:hypothetical protein
MAPGLARACICGLDLLNRTSLSGVCPRSVLAHRRQGVSDRSLCGCSLRPVDRGAGEGGPFNLGNIVLRAAICIDWHTPQVTDTSDPFPYILGGVPFLIGHVNVDIDRPGLHVQPDELQIDERHWDDHWR